MPRSFDRDSVRWYRLEANHLTTRLEPGAEVQAARSGLQDSSPRSAVLGLHARVAAVRPDAWEHPALAQVFGPRGAIYLVPRADIAVFTLGLLPRDPVRRAEIEADAERYCALAATATGPPNTRRARWAGATGRLLPRWDTRTTTIAAVSPPAADPEESRLELARRFLHAQGPATVAQLKWLTDGTLADAEATIAAIRDELTEVEVEGAARWLLAKDIDRLVQAGRPGGVRLLPPDDPYLSRVDKELLVSDPACRRRLWPAAPAPGALLVDGDIVGTWRRRRRTVTVSPWAGLVSAPVAASVETEVATAPIAGAGPARVIWERLTPGEGGRAAARPRHRP